MLICTTQLKAEMVTLRDGSKLKFDKKKIEIIDGLPSLGQNLFILSPYKSKNYGTLTTNYFLLVINGEKSSDPWCTGELLDKICKNESQFKDEKFITLSVASPYLLNDSVSVVHSISFNAKKNPVDLVGMYKNLLTNMEWSHQ